MDCPARRSKTTGKSDEPSSTTREFRETQRKALLPSSLATTPGASTPAAEESNRSNVAFLDFTPSSGSGEGKHTSSKAAGDSISRDACAALRTRSSGSSLQAAKASTDSASEGLATVPRAITARTLTSECVSCRRLTSAAVMAGSPHGEIMVLAWASAHRTVGSGSVQHWHSSVVPSRSQKGATSPSAATASRRTAKEGSARLWAIAAKASLLPRRAKAAKASTASWRSQSSSRLCTIPARAETTAS
mmetsp:Transcript_7160/g.16510  ORF Transcript_7160/g.16510 Transcript_7160/m.16510 type:complete len:247 (-) Transcript_7160:93-833(-)